MDEYKAFVIMPFNSKFDDVYKLGIKETAEKCGVIAERLDDQLFASNMVEQIYSQIDKSDFIIADMSDKNPNVFYEVGYADAKGKLVLLLTDNVDDIPFDFKQRPHIIYSNISLLKEDLEEKMKWAIEEVEKRNLKNLEISLRLDYAYIEDCNEYFDKAKVLFKLELQNQSSETLTDLQFLYFTVGDQWNIYIDDKLLNGELITENNSHWKRHTIVPDVKMIPPRDHIQIEIVGNKIVSFEKKSLRPDVYELKGLVGIEAFVANKKKKFLVSIKTECSDISLPF